MYKYTYGEYNDQQMVDLVKYMRKQIFFFILYVDKDTRDAYSNVDVNEAFESLLSKFAGYNSLLGDSIVLPRVMGTLKTAQNEYNSEDFKWRRYRALILEAGNDLLEILGGDHHAIDGSL